MNDVAGGIWQGVPQASRGQRKGRMAECVSMCFCMMARVWKRLPHRSHANLASCFWRCVRSRSRPQGPRRRAIRCSVDCTWCSVALHGVGGGDTCVPAHYEQTDRR